MLVGKRLQHHSACHRSVLGDDLSDQPDRLPAGEPEQIDRGFGVAGADQHAPVTGAKRECVPWTA